MVGRLQLDVGDTSAVGVHRSHYASLKVESRSVDLRFLVVVGLSVGGDRLPEGLAGTP